MSQASASAILPYQDWAKEIMQKEHDKRVAIRSVNFLTYTRGVGGIRNPTAGAYARQFEPMTKDKQDFLNAVDMAYVEHGMRLANKKD